MSKQTLSKKVKLDANDELLLAFEGAEKPYRAKKSTSEAKHVAGVVPKSTSIAEVSSWELLWQLCKRQYINVQIAGFWILLAGIVWYRLGK